MSYDEPLKAPLDHYIKLLPKVELIRHNQRSGLIVARMIGARRAKAPTIIFLDAHTEVITSVLAFLFVFRGLFHEDFLSYLLFLVLVPVL